MTLRAGWARFRRIERTLRNRWFPERQIILRERDSIRALRLRPDFQIAVAAVLVVGGLWSAWASVGYLANRASMAFAEAEVVDDAGTRVARASSTYLFTPRA